MLDPKGICDTEVYPIVGSGGITRNFLFPVASGSQNTNVSRRQIGSILKPRTTSALNVVFPITHASNKYISSI